MDEEVGNREVKTSLMRLPLLIIKARVTHA
jgi:hypothetical protein